MVSASEILYFYERVVASRTADRLLWRTTPYERNRALVTVVRLDCDVASLLPQVLIYRATRGESDS